jgi:hypothetical protein
MWAHFVFSSDQLNGLEEENAITLSLKYIKEIYAQTQGVEAQTFTVLIGPRHTVYWHVDVASRKDVEHHRCKFMTVTLNGAGTRILPHAGMNPKRSKELDKKAELRNKETAKALREGKELEHLVYFIRRSWQRNEEICLVPESIVDVPSNVITCLSSSSRAECATIHCSPPLNKQNRCRIVVGATASYPY